MRENQMTAAAAKYTLFVKSPATYVRRVHGVRALYIGTTHNVNMSVANCQRDDMTFTHLKWVSSHKMLMFLLVKIVLFFFGGSSSCTRTKLFYLGEILRKRARITKCVYDYDFWSKWEGVIRKPRPIQVG